MRALECRPFLRHGPGWGVRILVRFAESAVRTPSIGASHTEEEVAETSACPPPSSVCASRGLCTPKSRLLPRWPWGAGRLQAVLMPVVHPGCCVLPRHTHSGPTHSGPVLSSKRGVLCSLVPEARPRDPVWERIVSRDDGQVCEVLEGRTHMLVTQTGQSAGVFFKGIKPGLWLQGKQLTVFITSDEV